MKRSRARRPTAAVTAALTLLVVVAALAFGACGDQSSRATSSPSATASVGTSATGEQHGLIWKFTTGGAVRSSPAVSAGVVYFGSDDGYLYAVDGATGQRRWRLKTGKAVHWRSSNVQPSSPLVAGRVVYVGSNDGCLYAIDANSGRERWTFRTGGPVYSSPALAKGLVYVGSDDGHLYAVDSATGKQRWRFKPVVVLNSNTRTLWRPSPAEVRRLPGEKVSSSPVVSRGLVYAADALGVVHALDSRTGRWRWSHETGDDGSAAVSGGIVYQQNVALDAATGKKRWGIDADDEPSMGAADAPVIADGFAYYAGVTGWADAAILVAVDGKSGKGRWTFSPSGRLKDKMTVWFSPGFADGVVYFAGHDGRLYALDGQTGKEHWEFRPNLPVSSSPAISNGVVYFGSYDGRLYAVR